MLEARHMRQRPAFSCPGLLRQGRDHLATGRWQEERPAICPGSAKSVQENNSLPRLVGEGLSGNELIHHAQILARLHAAHYSRRAAPDPPRECERLQGFPDGWTESGTDGPQSDSARYRQLGNSVAVPVFEWVARGIVAIAESLGETA